MKVSPKLATAALVIVLALTAYQAYAAFTATHQISGTVAAGPVTPSTATFTANPPACTSACPGFIVTGTTTCITATVAVCVTGSAVTGTATFSGIASLDLVPAATIACGTTAPGGSIALTGTAVAIPAAGYEYCLYNTTWTSGNTLSVTVTYASP